MNRRQFIRAAGGAVAGASLTTRAHAATPSLWSDPASWKGGVPGRNDVAIVTKPILLDVDARVAGVVVRYGGALIFDPAASRTLTTTGNVVIKGLLRMKPRRRSVTHRIVFKGIDEAAFVGGGHDVLATDVGVWVMHHGSVDIAGSPITPWARAAAALPAMTSVVELDRDVIGWRPGDEIVVAPTGSPASPGHAGAFDAASITSITGRFVTLDRPLASSHPVATYGGRTFTAEVMNLTRNVRVEGTPSGRAHFFIHSEHPSSVRHAALRYVGPRRPNGSSSINVLGRYGLHFHHSYGAGGVVEGVVVRDCGNHSFVPHTSHGITFRGCIAYNVLEAAFWWDEGDVTNDTLWEGCIAAAVGSGLEGLAHKTAGFFLGRGARNVVRDSVAVGVLGTATAAGFMWPAEPVSGVWGAHDLIAHNNLHNGLFVWQKNLDVNVVERVASFHNGNAGVEHGSFFNAFRYQDCLLAANGVADLDLHANSELASDQRGLELTNVTMDGGGVTPSGLVVSKHIDDASVPVKHRNTSFVGHTGSPVRVAESSNFSSLQDYVGCTVGAEGRDLEPGDFNLASMATGSRLRVQWDDATAYEIDHTRTVREIPPFE